MSRTSPANGYARGPRGAGRAWPRARGPSLAAKRARGVVWHRSGGIWLCSALLASCSLDATPAALPPLASIEADAGVELCMTSGDCANADPSVLDPDAGTDTLARERPAKPCATGARRCLGVVPQRCTNTYVWKNEAVMSGRCGAECTPGEVDCLGAEQVTCGPDGRFDSGTLQVGRCGVECASGEERCEDRTPFRCDETGRWQAQAPERGTCNASCTPGDERCEGAAHSTCGPDGAWGAARTRKGSCGAVCTPGEQVCRDLYAVRCNLLGQWLSGVIVGGSCGALCTPGEHACDQKVRFTCSGGSQWADPAISTECGAACNPGEPVCRGGQLRTCEPDGTIGNAIASEPCTSSDADARQCTKGRVGCGIGGDLLRCPPGSDDCSVVSTVDDVYMTICDDGGHWTVRYCAEYCMTEREVGHACVVQGGEARCVDGGECP